MRNLVELDIMHTMPPTHEIRRRRGATVVEAAVVLPIFLVFLFTLLDLALAVVRYNSLAECARRAARAAIVRGELGASPLTPLGPDAWSGTCADAHPLTDLLRPLLVSMPPADVRFEATWPDGSHRIGQRVRIELRYEHHSLLASLFGNTAWSLSASSTMRIVH